MNPAIAFLLTVVVITGAVLWVVLRPLLAARAEQNNRAEDGTTVDAASVNTNVQALRIELAEARRDHRLGLLSATSLAEAERELETRVLSESRPETSVQLPRYKRTAIGLGLALPLLAIGGYAAVGTPVALVTDIVRPAQSQQATAQGAAPNQTQTPSQADQQMDELFRLAEERLKNEPNDVRGWGLLARAKASVGRFEEAMQAYERALALSPKDGELWADYADAAAGQAQGRMDGKPIELINKAIALDARNPKALLLRGTWELQKNDLAAAEKSFTTAKSLVEANSGFAQIADNAIADIQSRKASAAPGATTATTAVPSSAAAAGSSAAGAALASVQLQLAAEAGKTALPGSAIFVIVRAVGADRGPPLAAKKVSAADFDKPVLLTVADAMIGGAGLKAGTEVVIQARLSLNGQPAPQPGDWQSAKNTLRLPAGTLKLAIDQVIDK